MDESGPTPASGSGRAGSRATWLTFLFVGLVPTLVLAGNVIGATVPLVSLFPALAAVLVASSGDEHRSSPGDGTRRLLLGAGVAAVLAGATLARTGLGQPAYTAIVVGIPTVIAAWVLSGAYSPSPGVRALVRPLLSTAGSRSAYLVAALSWPVVAVLAVAICSRLPGMDLAAATPGLDLLTGRVVPGVVGAALAAVAWFGFAARQLRPRLAPLATGLLIGAVQWLVTWGTTLGWTGLAEPFFLARLAGSAAAALVAVWILDRSHGSLLPVWLLGALLPASKGVAVLLVRPEVVARADTLEQVFALLQVALAVVLIAGGRMWQRSTSPPPS